MIAFNRFPNSHLSLFSIVSDLFMLNQGFSIKVKDVFNKIFECEIWNVKSEI
jgi:hypothetical protein